MYARTGTAAPATPDAHGRSASHTYGEESAAALPDLRASELASVIPLVVLMFILGLYPYVLTRVMDALGEGMKLWH
jgi:NADH:ubiquinone oxidoreductase subunit 4 (subunit M)